MEENIRLKVPSWPQPDMQRKHFLRNFGQVAERKRGGSNDFAAEESYCSARMSIRYKDLHKQAYQLETGQSVVIYNSYRRLYADGYFLTKLELGFIDNLENRLATTSKEEEVPLISYLKHYLSGITCTVHGTDTLHYKAGKLLAANYCEATSTRKKDAPKYQQYVKDGQVCMVLVYTSNDNIILPKQAKKINEYSANDEFIKLYGYKLHLDDSYYKVWLIETTLPEQQLSQPLRNLLRRLRINLLRIHAEKETVRMVLNALKTGLVEVPEQSRQASTVQTYLKKASEKLFKKDRYALDQTDMLAFALQSEDTLQPGEFVTLEESVQLSINHLIKENVQRLLEKMEQQEKKLILLLSSSPTNKNPLDFGKELRQIEDALESSVDRGNFAIKPITAVKKAELLSLLNKYKPHYLHITLHASAVDGLYFESPTGQPAALSSDEFAEILNVISRKHKPEVIVLSACNSQQHALAAKPYCQYSVGMRMVFPEKASVLYAKCFYDMLFNDMNTDLETCHLAGVLGIKQSQPPFTAIDESPVHEIPVFND